MKMGKKIVAFCAVLISCICLFAGASAYFTDYETRSFSVKCEILQYNITYYSDGRKVSVMDEDTKWLHYNRDELPFTLPKASDIGLSKSGYSFMGWCENEDLSGAVITNIPTDDKGDKTYYAKWEKIYSITYYLCDGSMPETYDTTYVSSQGIPSLPVPLPAKNSSGKFMGWYESTSFQGEPVTSIPPGKSGYQFFYARWDEPVIQKGELFNKNIPAGVTSVVFTDEIAPDHAVLTDVSDAQDGRVVQWVEGITLKVSSQMSGVYPVINADSDSMFSGMQNYWPIGNVQCRKITSIDLRKLRAVRYDYGFGIQCSYMFCYLGADAESVELIGIKDINIDKANCMGYLFAYMGHHAKTVTLDITGWVSNPRETDFMFYKFAENAQEVNITGLEDWCPTSALWNSMFEDANIKTLNLNKWISRKPNFDNFVSSPYIEEINIENFTVGKSEYGGNDQTTKDMFKKCIRLKKITVGTGFQWLSPDGLLPVPDPQYIPGADGHWYNSKGEMFLPEEIPSKVADTYYASKELVTAMAGNLDSR